MLANIVLFNSDDNVSVVVRVGLVLCCLCLIFTTVRKYKNGDCSEVVACADFLATLELINVYLNNSILMFNNLASQSEAINYRMGDNKKAFYEVLLQSFQRKEAIGLGVKFSLSECSQILFIFNTFKKYNNIS